MKTKNEDNLLHYPLQLTAMNDKLHLANLYIIYHLNKGDEYDISVPELQKRHYCPRTTKMSLLTAK